MLAGLSQYALPLDLLARSGGGGSSSGGGDGIAFLAMVGYAPMHPIGSWVRKRKKNETEWIAGQVMGWVICSVFTLVLIALTYFIGIYALIMAAGAPLGMGAGLYNWFSKLKRSKKTEAALQTAALGDRAWDETSVTTRASQVFARYQDDWSSQNTESMRSYMTPGYHYYASLMVYAMKQSARRNTVVDPVISQIMVTDLHDSQEDSEDMVVVGITAKANDQLIDTRSDKLLFTDTNAFTEFWRFRRSGSDWLLDGIQQATAAQWTHNPSLEQFAATNGYRFNLDQGWLLLPRSGQLFGRGKFGISDINNHIIGVYNKCLIQFYTYSENPASSGAKSYLIAQANVPKSYGNIVVRRKKRFALFSGIRGLTRVSTEWGDFNKKYDVFATHTEQATSFELLHPVFMEKLEALPFEVNIEVVDNAVYLYAPEKEASKKSGASPERYDTMSALLREAFKQMQL